MISFRNIDTAMKLKAWMNRPEKGLELQDVHRIDTPQGIALIADGRVKGEPTTMYAIGRDDMHIKLARFVTWKRDVPTTLEQRIRHAEDLARQELSQWQPYAAIAHEFRKHA